MPDIPVEDWLQNWVEDNIRPQGHVQQRSDMSLEVETCRAQARDVGVSMDALDKAAGGDLAAFFMRQQNTRSNAEDALTAERLSKHRDDPE